MTHTTLSNLHGHTILKKLTETPMTLSELKSWLDGEYGSSYQFHTCSQDRLSFDAIITFFQSREKIVEVDGKWQTQAHRVCNH